MKVTIVTVYRADGDETYAGVFGGEPTRAQKDRIANSLGLEEGPDGGKDGVGFRTVDLTAWDDRCADYVPLRAVRDGARAELLLGDAFEDSYEAGFGDGARELKRLFERMADAWAGTLELLDLKSGEMVLRATTAQDKVTEFTVSLGDEGTVRVAVAGAPEVVVSAVPSAVLLVACGELPSLEDPEA